MANDSWINWGDFVGANKGQLDAYDQRVQQSQAEQQAAMQAALARLGTSYDAADKEEEAKLRDTQKALADQQLWGPTGKPPEPGPAPSTAPTPTQPPDGSRWDQRAGATSARPPANVIASGADAVSRGQGNISLTGGPGRAPAPAQMNPLFYAPDFSAAETAADNSYSALMAAQNAGQAAAFRGYQSPQAPGWQNALYSSRAQYTDPWASAQEQADKLKADHATRLASVNDAYANAVSNFQSSRGKTTKPVSTDVNGQPVYGQQEDTGPRNVAIKPAKPLDPVVGYA